MPRTRCPDTPVPRVSRRVGGWAFCLLAAISAAPDSRRAAASDHARDHMIDHPMADYLTHCGGCHGIEGRSPHTFVPELRDRVGVFLCSHEGRAYLAQVPGVTMSLIRDDQALADVLNLVVFRIGGGSTPPGVPAYTAAEIRSLRARPVQTDDLLAYRAGVLQRARAACPKS